jgi:alkaline phosphatase
MRPIISSLLLLVLFSNTVDADSFIKDQATIKATVHAIDQNALSNNHWYQQGDDWLHNRVKSFQVQSHSVANSAAKNIILFIGDGMSITTLTAARIWQGQQQGKLGEEHFLHFETFPHTALIKTYNSNQQTPDSAGTMSAIMTGVKTRAGIISMGPEQDKTDCKGSTQHHQQTLLEWGHKQGFATGIVTTARLTHATPAATYAHSPDRGWEGDYDRHPNAYWYGCDSIAKQLVEGAFPAGLDLALGGGGSRLQSYYESFHQQFPFGHLLNNQKELLKWDAVNEQPSQSGPVLGVFSSGHMDFESDRTDKQPSLKVMTKMALKYLQGLDKKYLLVIESARIDHAHHNGNAARALAETAMLADSVQLADDMTRDDDTLIIVTADHSHTFVMAGYPKRGNPILGVSKNQQDELVLANDGLPYTSLGYANGSSSGRAKNLQHFAASEDKNFHQEVAIALEAETHGSDDVALHAKGPGAYLFSGLMEQNEIFHTMLEALSSGDIKVEESK